ncbi:MAG: YebC/PmpR family DNA-binding transcriptional regulator [Planctomycetes bacterium]|nr:YebC/PmpR family DNA-binding transcriptional regulator [Planctomycetota bacterium]
MSGHSHWATIKHKKGAADAKKGKAFSKVSRLIIMAARQGGGDPANNIKLLYAIESARAVNMPRDTIDRAIKRGTGELEGVMFEEVAYEGYGPGGVAVMVDALTDNRNRSAHEIRKIFETHAGNLGTAGCVAFMFERKGVMNIPIAGINEDELMGDVLDAGADNMEKSGDYFEITCAPTDFAKVKDALAKKYKVESAEIAMMPKNRVEVDEDTGRKLISLLDALEDNDDVQKVHSNFELPETLLK